MPDASAETDRLLRQVWGFGGFRPGQAEVVDAVIAGRDVLAIMPTGGGKSLCYQLPALIRDGVTVVISPLIALMRDQVRALREAGVGAGALTSGNTEEETRDVYEALSAGRIRLLYMAPERLASGGTLGLLRRAGVTAIAVDEAHCVSQWGHDFRPDYLRIGDLKRGLGVPLSAFTATADAETQAEIVSRLFGGAAPQVFLRGFDRPNIHLAFQPKDGPRAQIMRFADARRGQSGIVYCGTRAKTEALAGALVAAGHAAVAYHGGMEADTRREVEAQFQREDGLIVVATVAFGMGIDKPDIRWVAHADLPKSIEAYYQEIGRAGRDGAPAETLTLYGPEDIRLRRGQVDEGLADAVRKEADHARLNALLGLAEATGCRRQRLLTYFGEDSAPCGNCDLCDTPPEVFDATRPVRMALSAMLRTGEWFGAGHIIDVLSGNETDKVRERGHDRLPTFGVGRDLSRGEWQAVIRQMMGLDLCRPDPARHGALHITEAAHPVLRGEETVTLRRDLVVRGRKPAVVVRAQVSDEDAPLLSALKAKRRALAEAARVPAYVIFADRTLIEMAEKRPATLDAMARISGVGAKKLESYGDAFLQVIAGDVPDMHPARRKLAGQASGLLYDRLAETAQRLQRGEGGVDKALTPSASQLRRIADARPQSLDAMGRFLGDAYLDRFGAAFLDDVLTAG